MSFELTDKVIRYLRLHEIKYELRQRDQNIDPHDTKEALAEQLKVCKDHAYAGSTSRTIYEAEKEDIVKSYKSLSQTLAAHEQLPNESIPRFTAIATHVVNRIKRIKQESVCNEVRAIEVQLSAVLDSINNHTRALESKGQDISIDGDDVQLPISVVQTPDVLAAAKIPSSADDRFMYEEEPSANSSVSTIVEKNGKRLGRLNADINSLESEDDQYVGATDAPDSKRMASEVFRPLNIQSKPSAMRQLGYPPVGTQKQFSTRYASNDFVEQPNDGYNRPYVGSSYMNRNQFNAHDYRSNDQGNMRSNHIFSHQHANNRNANAGQFEAHTEQEQTGNQRAPLGNERAHLGNENADATGVDLIKAAVKALSSIAQKQSQMPVHSWPYRFSGDIKKDKLNVSEFLNGVVKYANNEQITEKELMNKVEFLLEGEAAQWFKCNQDYILNFDVFCYQMLKRYRGEDASQLRLAIYQKRQSTEETTLQYVESFLGLVMRLEKIDPMPSREQFKILMAGIAPDIRTLAMVQGVRTVRELYEFVLDSVDRNHRIQGYRGRLHRVNQVDQNEPQYESKDNSYEGNDSTNDLQSNNVEEELAQIQASVEALMTKNRGQKKANRPVVTEKAADSEKTENTKCPLICSHQECIAKRLKLFEQLQKNITEKEASQIDSSGERLPMVCYRCNGMGHAFKDCPNTAPVCANCKKVGVYTKRCDCKLEKSVNTNVSAVESKPSRNEPESNEKLEYEELFKLDQVQTCAISVNPIYIPHEDGRPHCKVQVGEETIIGLLDTGSQCTVIGLNHYARSEYLKTLTQYRSRITLSTADKTSHQPICLLRVPYRIKKGDGYVEKIVNTHIAPVEMNRPIFGIDFQCRFGISLTALVELLDTSPAKATLLQRRHELTAEQEIKLKEVLALFPFSSDEGELNCTTKIEHKIDLVSNTPIYVKPHGFTPEKLAKAKIEIDRLLRRGIIEPVTKSQWNLPVLLVNKPDGRVRIVLDGRRLNLKTVPNKYPQMNIERIYSRITEIEYISSIDVSDAFLQIGLAEECRDMTCFTILGLGKFRYRKMPPGLINSCSTLCTLVDAMFSEVNTPNIYCYLDDFLLINKTFDEHLDSLRLMAQKFTDVELAISSTKSHFMMMQLKWLGQILSAKGMQVDPDRIEAIQKMKRPETEKEIRKLIGLTSWFRRYIDNYATITAPLTSLLQKTDDNLIRWTEAAEVSFANLKHALTHAPILRAPDHSKPFIIDASSSENAISAMLSQQVNDEHRVIAYMSAKLPVPQQRLSPAERNILAIIHACDKWRMFIDGKPTTVITNAPNVNWLMQNREATGRLTRYALRLQTYQLEFKNRQTKRQFVHVDVLSETIGEEVQMLDVKAMNLFDECEMENSWLLKIENDVSTESVVNSIAQETENKVSTAVEKKINQSCSPQQNPNNIQCLPKQVDYLYVNGFVQVYTDGSCIGNGNQDAKAGIGIWFNDNHHLNAYEPISGKPTNNRAEIQAAIRAIEIASQNNVDALTINSDSQFMISAITNWVRDWKDNNWLAKNGEAIVNKDDFVQLDEAISSRPNMCIQWNYVPGHSEVHGNEQADQLARKGAEIYKNVSLDGINIQNHTNELPGNETDQTVVLDCSMISISPNEENEWTTEREQLIANESVPLNDRWQLAYEWSMDYLKRKAASSNYLDLTFNQNQRQCDIIDVENFENTECEWYKSLLQEVNEGKLEDQYQIVNGVLYHKPQRVLFKPEIKWKVVVPSDFIDQVLEEEHNQAAHPGLYRTICRVKSKYHFPKMYVCIKEYVAKCTICNLSKLSNEQTRTPLGGERTPKHIGQTLCCDFVGPLTQSKFPNKSRWLFVMTCKLSKFVWLTSMKQATALNVIEFIEKNIRMTFGITPEEIICDNGKQFVSHVFRNYCAQHKIRIAYTPIRHPQANAAENVNRMIGNAIRAQLIESELDQDMWDSRLPEIANALNSTPHTQTKCPPFVAMFGRNAISQGHDYKHFVGGEENDANIDETIAKRSVIASEIIKNLHKAYLVYQNNYNKRTRVRVFKVGDLVYLKNFKQSKKGERYMSKLAAVKQQYIVDEVLSGNRYSLRKVDVGNKRDPVCVVYSANDMYTY